MNRRILETAIVLCCCSFATAIAQPAAAPHASPPTIQVTGEANVTRAPDRVEVELAVVTRSPTSREAVAANARQTRAVIEALRGELGDGARLESVGYSLYPQEHRPEDGAPKITGYIARNTVRVVLDDLDRVGQAIDTAANAGANQVQRIAFSLRDEREARAAALAAATADARALAERAARALDVRIAGVRSVVVSGSAPRPMRELAMARADATPIIAGPIEVRANVTVTFDVAEGARSTTGER